MEREQAEQDKKLDYRPRWSERHKAWLVDFGYVVVNVGCPPPSVKLTQEQYERLVREGMP